MKNEKLNWTVGHDQHDWLDKHIIEQDDHYDMSPARKANLFAGAAEFGEMLEAGVVEEPERKS